jgi:hypothetical protein
MEVRRSRDLPSAPASVTAIKDAAGRYFASFVVQTGPAADAARFPAPDTSAEVGIDLGLTSFAVLSDGTVVRAPRFLRRAERKLRRLQLARTAQRLAGVVEELREISRGIHPAVLSSGGLGRHSRRWPASLRCRSNSICAPGGGCPNRSRSRRTTRYPRRWPTRPSTCMPPSCTSNSTCTTR